MHRYQYIPFPELRRQYQYRCQRRKLLAQLSITVLVSAVYGIVIGLMVTGMWFTF